MSKNTNGAAAWAAALQEEPVGAYKLGENGPEGKCALCGVYVIKGAKKFREKSVVCPECAARAAKIVDPYHVPAGRR